MIFARRVDVNHSAIVAELRQAGITVVDLSRCGRGVPDLLVRRRERVLLVEIKRPGGGRLTKHQRQFIGDWGAHVVVATCAEDVISELDVREFGG